MTKPPIQRCAIYTRKSSDEGLDQTFNSLDAQREAGEAYVLSQAGEGWRTSATRYDDGGFSGGTMERPGLQRLLDDIEAGLIDVVVVYKIDRLTRSLADFARIVERFDARGVSFVSVTQSFNTTTSMGRLTLNVLLSFAQFEREVTGERIRDKIAASKAKGMWMGGVPPLGYDLPAAGTRTLQVNETEAATVRAIFTRYLALGSVHRLADDLAQRGIVSKRRVTGTGKTLGGFAFTRGALFHLLRNRIYLGKITHKGLIHEGEHEAIVDQALFDQVQQMLATNTRRHGDKTALTLAEAQLTGRIFDAAGNPMSPTHARGRSGKIYRYYVSAPLQQGIGKPAGAMSKESPPQRIAAPAIEELVSATLSRLVPTEHEPLRKLRRLELHRMHVVLVIQGIASAIEGNLCTTETITRDLQDRKSCRITIPVALSYGRSRTTITSGTTQRARRDPILIDALRRAHRLIQRDKFGPLVTAAPATQYARRLTALALLAPDIQRDIQTGRQPPNLTLAALIATELPLDWAEQRVALGYPIKPAAGHS